MLKSQFIGNFTYGQFAGTQFFFGFIGQLLVYELLRILSGKQME